MPADKKPKGKKSAYNFFLKAASDEHKKKYPQEKFSLKEFSQQCSAKWKELDAKTKQRFIDQAENDKVRYEKEMKNFVPNDQENRASSRNKGSTKKPKDPNAPKRPLSAYLLFSGDMRAQVKSEQPELKPNEVLKVLGTRWKEASPSVRARYEGLAVKAKQGYEKEMSDYSNGRIPLKAKSPNKNAKSKAQGKVVAASKKKQPEVQKEESDESEEESEEEESDDQNEQSKDANMDEESSEEESD